ncbi:hypothetical protein YDYSY3_19320 [Paenibacillus chitinolyticus]|nr:hypothetical protein YDYSY3_19320 [Paenibacillus chitinolyticus]
MITAGVGAPLAGSRRTASGAAAGQRTPKREEVGLLPFFCVRCASLSGRDLFVAGKRPYGVRTARTKDTYGRLPEGAFSLV